MKVTIDGKQHEIEPSDLELGEGFALITPDNVPDGYYTQDALESKIKTRLSKAEENVKSRLAEDNSFHKQILDQYGVSLGPDGKPKGLKPEVDIDEVKKNVAESIKEQYEKEKSELKSKLDNFVNKGLKSTIVEGANKIGIDGKYLEPLVEGGDPYLVKELSDKFAYNDEIGDYAMLDNDGTFAVDGNGFVTTDKFFEKNTEKFKHMLKDQRQRGSNFKGQGNPLNGKPKGDPTKWDRSKKLEYIGEHGKDGFVSAIKEYKSSKTEE